MRISDWSSDVCSSDLRIPAMVLATTAQSKGCDAIAAAWAARTGTPLVAFTLNSKFGQRAGFLRNEQLLGLNPVEALVCEGSGLQSHLARLRSEERRVGKEWVSACISRWST